MPCSFRGDQQLLIWFLISSPASVFASSFLSQTWKAALLIALSCPFKFHIMCLCSCSGYFCHEDGGSSILWIFITIELNVTFMNLASGQQLQVCQSKGNPDTEKENLPQTTFSYKTQLAVYNNATDTWRNRCSNWKQIWGWHCFLSLLVQLCNCCQVNMVFTCACSSAYMNVFLLATRPCVTWVFYFKLLMVYIHKCQTKEGLKQCFMEEEAP
jgi:hypothetical protein